MVDWKQTLVKLAPTVASVLGGPLAGAGVAALAAAIGLSDEATESDIIKQIENGQLTAEQISNIKQLELKYQSEEKERGFRYSELEFKDRDSARKANVEGGTMNKIFWLSLVLLTLTLGTELVVLFQGYPKTLPEIIVGRILGLMDSIALTVLAFWYGTSSGSARKTDMLNAK